MPIFSSLNFRCFSLFLVFLVLGSAIHYSPDHRYCGTIESAAAADCGSSSEQSSPVAADEDCSCAFCQTFYGTIRFATLGVLAYKQPLVFPENAFMISAFFPEIYRPPRLLA